MSNKVKGMLVLASGICLVYQGFDGAIFLWANESAYLPQLTKNAIFGSVLLFFIGIGLIIFSFYLFFSTKKQGRLEEIEAMDWQHFKPRNAINEQEIVSVEPQSLEEKKIQAGKEKLNSKSIEKSQLQEPYIKTNQVLPELNEGEIQSIQKGLKIFKK